MSDFGMFEADEATAREPRAQARTAARKMDAAIDVVRAKFGRFLLGATGVDEFSDRWHYSKHDIRASVEPYIFPNTGTMRRLHNALKQDWKIAHPYKLAIDHDDAGFGSMPTGDSHRNQDLDETYRPSSGNLIPEDNFEGYKDSVDQGGPEKVEAHDFTDGNDSGSDRREAARLVADIYTDFARSNGLRVASLDTLDHYAATGIHEADYNLLQSMILRTAECDESCDDDDEEDSDTESEAPSDSESDDSDSGYSEGEAPDFGGESASEGESESDDDEDEDGESDDDDYGFGDEDGDGDHDDDDHHAEGGEEGGGQQYTVPEHAPELDPQMLNEIPHDDPQGAAPVPPNVIDSLLGLPEGTIEQLLLEEVEQGQGGDPGMSGPPAPPQGGGDDFFGGGGDEPEQEPQDPRMAARRFWAAEGDEQSESGGDSGGGGEQAAPPAQDPAAAMGGDPAAMGAQQPMLPPPGSQAVAPPQPPQQLENQPAEDALLDTANQAIMQMIDQETAEYQQIIDPLSQALQAIQFAQQVEQTEHPMDVTPPQGTVDVAPSAAPGGAGNPMQQQAMRRRRMAGVSGEPCSYCGSGPGEPCAHTCPIGGDENHVDLREIMFGPHRKTFSPEEEERMRDQLNGEGRYARRHFWAAEEGKKLCYHPRSCPKCDSKGSACGAHVVGSEGHERCSGSGGRQAKVEFGIRNAAKLIAHRYRLSSTGHQMLLNAALGRRGYEHVVEALKLVPLDVRKAAAIHMSHLFAAGNDRFNKDVFLRTVLASNPRDRAGDAWRDGRDRGVAEHGRHDMDDYGDEGPLVSSSEPWQGFGDQGHPNASDVPWSEHHRIRGGATSRSRLPFELPRHTAGETMTPTSTMDGFEFPLAGQVTRIDDNNDSNDLPVMPGADPHGKNAASQKAVDRFRRWQQRQQQMGLSTTEGESAVHNFLQTSNPGRKRVGPDAQNMIHRELGLQPDAVKTPKANPVKAVNPVLKGKGGATPSAPEAKSPAPKAAPKTASFFTRKVPGWRWDDHLSGYLSKEAKAFTCSCGHKHASPSYNTCKCGKIWNIYAIGDTHHLASDTAEVFIAREIPVRDNVIMANRKLAKGDSDCTCWDGYERVPGTEPCASKSCRKKTGATTRAQGSFKQYLAEIERLADWTKYDGPDPTRDPKVKPPSTTIKSQPGDWTNRDFTGPTKGQWREPEPTELPRKTRKKK